VRRSTRRRAEHDHAHRRHRPGNHQHARRRRRPRRAHRLRRAAPARADLPPGRLGRARPDRDLDQHPGGHRSGPRQGQPHSARRRRGRHQSPTRETAVDLGASDGKPVYNAIVWQDTRTQDAVDALAASGEGGVRRFATVTGLPLATYFSATKISWILDNVEGARARAEAGELAFGTIDTWLLWNLTGGPDGGVHATDVTKRLAHAAARPRHARLERRAARGVPRPPRPAARGAVVVGGVRGRAVELAAARGARGGHPGRSAGGHVRPGGLRGRRVEEHVRHRQLPDRQHR